MELCLNIETCEYNMQKKRIRRNARKAITTTSPNEKYTQMPLLVRPGTCFIMGSCLIEDCVKWHLGILLIG
jgi:hypothetical protein